MSRSRLVSQACDRCKAKKRKCDGKKPCASCIAADLPCSYDIVQKKRGPAPGAGEKKRRGVQKKSSSSTYNPSHAQTDPDYMPFRETRRSSHYNTYQQASTPSFDALEEEILDELSHEEVQFEEKPRTPLENEIFDEAVRPIQSESPFSQNILQLSLPDPLKTRIDYGTFGVNVSHLLNNNMASPSKVDRPSVPNEFTQGMPITITRTHLLEYVSCFFRFFHESFMLFDEPTILRQIESDSVPLHLLSCICAVGSLFSQIHGTGARNVPIAFAEIARKSLPQSTLTVQERESVVHSMILLSLFDYGMGHVDTFWIWNGIGCSLAAGAIESLSPAKAELLYSSVVLADFLSAITSARSLTPVPKPKLSGAIHHDTLYIMNLIDSDSPFRILDGFPMSPAQGAVGFEWMKQRAKTSEFVLISQLVEICAGAWANRPHCLECHTQLISWWDALPEDYKLVTSLPNLVVGGTSMLNEPKWLYAPNNHISSIKVLINLLFFASLAQIHRQNQEMIRNTSNSDTMRPIKMGGSLSNSCDFFSLTENIDSGSLPAFAVNSGTILAACYRAQNRILRKMHQTGRNIIGLPFLATLLFPAVIPLLMDSQYSPSLILGSTNGIAMDNSLESVSTNIFPALEACAKIWPGVESQLNQLRELCSTIQRNFLNAGISVAPRPRSNDATEILSLGSSFARQVNSRVDPAPVAGEPMSRGLNLSSLSYSSGLPRLENFRKEDEIDFDFLLNL